MSSQSRGSDSKPLRPKINEIVKTMLQLHVGGKEFFENLDFAVRDPDIIQSLYNEIENFIQHRMHIYVVTGKFGMFFKNWIECYGADNDYVYGVNGGLRNGEPIESLEPFKKDFEGADVIIIDDSFYSGRTVDTIIDHIMSLGANYKGTFVIYDGSKEKRSDIHSLYRYYESKQLNDQCQYSRM